MKRSLFDKICGHLDNDQVSLIIGARQVGKTTIINQLKNCLNAEGRNVFLLTLEDPEILRYLNDHPKNLLQLFPPLGEDKIYVLIDEIQYLDDPSNFLKLIYDLYKGKIKLVVTGSSSFYIDSKFNDSLAGRKRIFELYTLTFAEMLRFKGYDEYSNYFQSGFFPKIYDKELKALLNEYILFGGYPRVVLENDISEKKEYLNDIVDSYVKKDAVEADLHEVDAYQKILRILAHQAGSMLNFNNLANDINLSVPTLSKYIHVMRKSFHLGVVTPFTTNITKEITKMPKVYFNDLGLLNCLLRNFTPIPLNENKGFVFENFIYRWLLDSHSSDNINFWRTQKKQEVDFIISLDNGTRKAYEVKFSKSLFNESKYNYFKKCYPDIPLELVDFDSIINFFNTNQIS